MYRKDYFGQVYFDTNDMKVANGNIKSYKARKFYNKAEADNAKIVISNRGTASDIAVEE